MRTTAHHWYLYSDRKLTAGVRISEQMVVRDNWGAERLPIPGSLWLSAVLPVSVRRDKIEVFWGTSGVLPVGLPRRVKTVLTVHDLVWHFYPETMAAYSRLVFKTLAKWSIKHADIIISPSVATGKALENVLMTPSERIRVVPEGVGREFIPRDRGMALELVERKYHIRRPYILTVGTIEPRKNVARLIEAFALMCGQLGGEHSLVVAGKSGWKTWRTRESAQTSELRDRIHFLGWVESADLPWLYAGAEVCVLPSLYEGFGLPVLEAMACGCPVVVSNCSSLSEVGGDAAITVDPLDPQSISEGMAMGIKKRDELAIASMRHARRFSWETAAAETVRTIEEAGSR